MTTPARISILLVIALLLLLPMLHASKHHTHPSAPPHLEHHTHHLAYSHTSYELIADARQLDVDGNPGALNPW
jgi:hypothetical protein